MFLPSSVQSYLDGRLDQMEKRVAALLYKQSVELDMGMSILADCVNLVSPEEKRGECRSREEAQRPSAAGADGKACTGAAGQ